VSSAVNGKAFSINRSVGSSRDPRPQYLSQGPDREVPMHLSNVGQICCHP
jgi:hypothetical protein